MDLEYPQITGYEKKCYLLSHDANIFPEISKRSRVCRFRGGTERAWPSQLSMKARQNIAYEINFDTCHNEWGLCPEHPDQG